MTSPAMANTANEDTTVRKIADEAFAAFNSGHHVLPFSTRYPAFSLNDAYRAAALAHNMRIAKGYTPLGRKIGFTNRRMWDEWTINGPWPCFKRSQRTTFSSTPSG